MGPRLIQSQSSLMEAARRRLFHEMASNKMRTLSSTIGIPFRVDAIPAARPNMKPFAPLVACCCDHTCHAGVAQSGPLSIQIGPAERLRTIQSGFYGRQPNLSLRHRSFTTQRLRCHAFNRMQQASLFCSRSVVSTNNHSRLRPGRRWKQDNDRSARGDSNSRYRNNKRGWFRPLEHSWPLHSTTDQCQTE